MGKRSASKVSGRSKTRDEKSFRSLLIKASVLTVAFCLLVAGVLITSFMSQEKSIAPGALQLPVDSPSSAQPSVSSSTRAVAAPLPEKTFDKSAKDSYSPPASSPPISLKPSSLSIPSVGISSDMVGSGAKNGSMLLPESSKVAQYTEASPLTAKEGSTVIAGHVNFADGSPGALGTLHKIEKGAPVYATDANGKVHKYKVVALDVLKKEALPFTIFRTAGDRQLVVVTCGGGIETVNGIPVYASNLIVTAVPAA